MTLLRVEMIGELYAGFASPITELDCGQKCAPYNGGIPFCCDTRHAVPTAYLAEWRYLQTHTSLWHLWEAEERQETARLREEVGDGLVLIACRGHQHCQRDYRSFVCRAFPFFPYLDSRGEFLGLSYYWDYEDRCWVISNLHVVSEGYRREFIHTFEQLFRLMPEERETFSQHSAEMRRQFARRRRAIPLLHRNGKAYKISPGSERMRRVAPQRLPKFGVYKVAALLPFPDEDGHCKLTTG